MKTYSYASGGWLTVTNKPQPRCPHCHAYLTYRPLTKIYECRNTRCPVIYTREATGT